MSNHLRIPLAQDGPIAIEHCSCSSLHVHVGATTFRLHPDDFASLRRAVEASAQALQFRADILRRERSTTATPHLSVVPCE